ncbi:MAG: hypothetical protein RL605_706 [Actinomycetota bacterium]|jgi:methionine-rich copper-binding protein CopC
MRKFRPVLSAAAIAVAAALTLGWGASAASAHDELVLANPSISKVLKVAPKAVTLTFDDSVTDVAGANQIVVIDPKGHHLETGGTKVSVNAMSTKLIASKLLGKFKVLYRVLSADGHPVTGFYYFYVRK